MKKGRAAKKNATGGGKRRPTKESEQVGGQVADIYEAEEIKEEGANRPGRYDVSLCKEGGGTPMPSISNTDETLGFLPLPSSPPLCLASRPPRCLDLP